ncbi:hypothetical protein [Actinoplanes sp. ATCC 53533]|uniref:hypothetical protein n=1 Tax=Actinoplanes sp. ATCC 53533 TaxID=1288362 RepID=UPI000F7B7B72|nr:hypothetical protein [Actinoplanes sp. ATCC 53533]
MTMLINRRRARRSHRAGLLRGRVSEGTGPAVASRLDAWPYPAEICFIHSDRRGHLSHPGDIAEGMLQRVAGHRPVPRGFRRIRYPGGRVLADEP